MAQRRQRASEEKTLRRGIHPRRIQQPTEEGGSRPVSRVLSRTAIHLGHASPHASSDLPGCDAGRVVASLFGLAPGGVYHRRTCYQVRGALLPHHFTLTIQRRTVAFGGIFSAALSVGLRLPGVTWHPALRSPDFPLSLAGQRSFGRLPGAKIVCKRVYRNRYLSVYMLPTSSISNRIRLFPRKNRGNSQVGHCFSADFLLLETMEFETGPKDV